MIDIVNNISTVLVNGTDATFNSINGTSLNISGGGTFDYVDKIEGVEPATPPANTLRLFVVEQDGFSRYNYKDEYGVTRTINDDEIIVNNSLEVPIVKNRAVYVNNYSLGIPTVALAKADNISTMPSICITVEDINPHLKYKNFKPFNLCYEHDIIFSVSEKEEREIIEFMLNATSET